MISDVESVNLEDEEDDEEQDDLTLEEGFVATIDRLLSGPSCGDQSWNLQLQQYVNFRVNNYYGAHNASSAGSVGRALTLSSLTNGEGTGLVLFDHIVESLQLTPEDMVRLRALEKRFSSIQQNIANHESSLEFARSVSESAGIIEVTTLARSRSNASSNAADDVSVSEMRRTAEPVAEQSSSLTTTAVRNIGFSSSSFSPSSSTPFSNHNQTSARSMALFFGLLVLSQAPFLALFERAGKPASQLYDSESFSNSYVREAYSDSFLLILTACVGLLVPGGLEVVLLLAPRGISAMIQFAQSKLDIRRVESRYMSMILDERLLQLQMAHYKSTIILATVLPYSIFVLAQILSGQNTEDGELYSFIPVVHMQINVYFACFAHLGASNATPSGMTLLQYLLGFASFSGLTFVECLQSIIDDRARDSNSILVALSCFFQAAFGIWLINFFWYMLVERERLRARGKAPCSVFKNTLVYACMFVCLFILDLIQQYDLLPLNGLTAAVVLRTCLAVVFFVAPFHFHLAESKDYDSAFKDVLFIAQELNNTSFLEEGDTLSLSSQGERDRVESTSA